MTANSLNLLEEFQNQLNNFDSEQFTAFLSQCSVDDLKAITAQMDRRVYEKNKRSNDPAWDQMSKKEQADSIEEWQQRMEAEGFMVIR